MCISYNTWSSFLTELTLPTTNYQLIWLKQLCASNNKTLFKHNHWPALIFHLAPAVIQPGDNITTEGVLNYFQTSCNIFSNRVLVELIDVRGTSFLYASNSVTNPGPLTPNTVANVTPKTNRRTVTVFLHGTSKVHSQSS